MSIPRVVAWWARTRTRTFADRTALERYQRRRLATILAFAVRHSSFYRDTLGDVRRPLAELPIIDKAAMMSELDRLNTAGITKARAFEVALGNETRRDFARDLDGITVGLSSGTSGSRGLFLASAAERDMYAGVMLAKLLPGSLISSERDRVALFLRANSQLYEAVGSKRIRFVYFDLLDEVEEHVARLSALQPTLIFAPPSMLRLLADARRKGRLRIAPKRIYSVAEVLDPVDERHLEQTFGQRIHQVYQATEGHLGQTCAHGTLHLNEDLVIVEPEWIDERRFTPVLTDLYRTTQPIVRYRLNDVLVERDTACPCGSPMRALERVEGREDDVFHFVRERGGGTRPVFADFVRRAVLMSSDAVREYGVRQTGPTALELFVDAEPGRREEAYRAAESRLRSLARELGCTPPTIERLASWTRPRGAKLKRIERAFALGA